QYVILVLAGDVAGDLMNEPLDLPLETPPDPPGRRLARRVYGDTDEAETAVQLLRIRPGTPPCRSCRFSPGTSVVEAENAKGKVVGGLSKDHWIRGLLACGLGGS